jgi:hypothetical protein
MTARVTEEEVKEIIDTSLTPLTVFINTAHIFVENTLTVASFEEETLKEIERNLAAHFLSNRDMRVTAEKVDTISLNYAGRFDLGLNGTLYGQTAILLDHTGVLASVAKNGMKRSASIAMMEYHESV